MKLGSLFLVCVSLMLFSCSNKSKQSTSAPETIKPDSEESLKCLSSLYKNKIEGKDNLSLNELMMLGVEMTKTCQSTPEAIDSFLSSQET